MRNFILILILCLTSCAAVESGNSEELHPLNFSLSTEKVRSRSELVYSYLDVDDFGIFGFNDFYDPFIFNLLAERGYRSWSHSSTVVWEDINDTQTAFIAYSPYVADDNGMMVSVENSLLILHYDTPQIAENHPYIMVSYPVIIPKGNVDDVLFVMQHPLCAVSFVAEDLDVDKFELVGVATSAELRVSMDGSYAWDIDADESRVVELSAGDYAMIIPQTLDSDAFVRAVLRNGDAVELSLDGQEWTTNERVDYLVAADSLKITLRKELNP